MKIESIINLSDIEYLSVLPKYQKEIVSQLIDSYGVNDAIDKWIEANGPENNAQFGGIGNGNFLSKLKDSIKTEINKFICGYSKLEKIESLQFNAGAKTLQVYIVSTISSIVAQTFSISAVSIAPIVVMILISVKKIGLTSYCEVVGFPRK
ncbi:MAG: hypothetical protein ACRC0V_07725 [Fusobacteriaceae bacterium]